jgi:hypothetical protein
VWKIHGTPLWLSVIVSPWPGKCFSVAATSRCCVPSTEHCGRRQPRHELRALAERAHADHRVAGVDVHIGDRTVVLVDAERPQLVRRHPCGVERVGRAARRAERHVAGEGCRGRPDARHHAVLLVGRDQQRDAGRLGERGALDAVRQVRDLRGLVEVVRPAEVDDAAELVRADQVLRVADAGAVHRLVGRDVVRIRRVGAFAVHVRDEQLADLLAQRHALDRPVDPAVIAARGGGGRGGQRGERREHCQPGDHRAGLQEPSTGQRRVGRPTACPRLPSARGT